jgi:hypothetical protein
MGYVFTLGLPMSHRCSAGVVTAFVFGLSLWLGNTVANAQSQTDSKYLLARPVYLNIHPIGDAQHVFSEDLVTAMAQQKLTAMHDAVISTQGNHLPSRVRVLRIFYIVNQQSIANGVVMAATAKVDLLRTTDRHDTVLATSIYSGVLQTMAQGPQASQVKLRLRQAFKKELYARIHQAFTNTAAQ